MPTAAHHHQGSGSPTASAGHQRRPWPSWRRFASARRPRLSPFGPPRR